MKEFRTEQLDMRRSRAQLMTPEPIYMRQRLSIGQNGTHFKLRIPPLAEPPNAYGMRGRAWRRQLVLR